MVISSQPLPWPQVDKGVLWINRTGIVQVFYDRDIEPATVRPGFAISDLDVSGARPQGFTPLTSIYEVLDQKPDASICLVRVSSIGDILLLFPLFYRIRELYPLCRLFFASVKHYLPMVKYIDFITGIDSKKVECLQIDFGYDFDLSIERAERAGWGRKYHRSDAYAKFLGIDLQEYKFSLPYSDMEKIKVSALLQRKGYTDGPLIGFQLRGANASRSFPIDKVKRIVNRLTMQGMFVVLLDGDKNIGWEGKNIINMCGEVDILELVVLVDMCNLVVSTDSGITHIAGATGKTNVAFFGCIPAENRVKYPNCEVVDLAKAWGCEPCWESGEQCGQRWSCLVEADESLIHDRIMEQIECMK